jgi:proline iminopeptidase
VGKAHWLYRGVARFFPEEWARFRAAVDDDDVVAGYAHVLESSDTMREAALAATERFKELPA